MAKLPISSPLPGDKSEFDELSCSAINATSSIKSSDVLLADWLKFEHPIINISTVLRESSKLDVDGFVAAVRSALPKRQGLTPTQLRQLREAFSETAEPARQARIELLAYERRLAAMVERAYGLTDEEIALMWRTAPPRMPLAPPPGLDLRPLTTE